MVLQPRHLTMTPIEYRATTGSANEVRRLTVESIDNHIYFYADVDSDQCRHTYCAAIS